MRRIRVLDEAVKKQRKDFVLVVDGSIPLGSENTVPSVC